MWRRVTMKIYCRLERDRMQCVRKLSTLSKKLLLSELGSLSWSCRRRPWRSWWLDAILNRVTTQKEPTFPAASLGTSNIFNFYLYCCSLGTNYASNMTGTDCGLFTHNQSRSYLNHLVIFNVLTGSMQTVPHLRKGSVPKRVRSPKFT
jgi:hypothetical protein